MTARAQYPRIDVTLDEHGNARIATTSDPPQPSDLATEVRTGTDPGRLVYRRGNPPELDEPETGEVIGEVELPDWWPRAN